MNTTTECQVCEEFRAEESNPNLICGYCRADFRNELRDAFLKNLSCHCINIACKYCVEKGHQPNPGKSRKEGSLIKNACSNQASRIMWHPDDNYDARIHRRVDPTVELAELKSSVLIVCEECANVYSRYGWLDE